MSLERSVSPSVESLYQLEDLAAQHAKELADLQIIQDLEIKHARQRAELRAKQEAELARRKRENEANLKSVSDLSRGKKRRRESDDVSLERRDGRQSTSSSTIKAEEVDDDVFIISSIKRIRRAETGSQIKSPTSVPNEPKPPPMLEETPIADPTTNDADEPSQSLVRDGLPRSEPLHNSVDQHQFQSPALPRLGHENPQTPSRETPSLFTPPHPLEQSENAGSASPTGPSNIQSVIKSELEESDMPYLEIGNLQPESFKRGSPVPPISSTPPRSPTRPAASDEQLLSRSPPIPLTRILPRHTSPAAQTSSEAFPQPRVPNSPPILPLQQISQNVSPPSVPATSIPTSQKELPEKPKSLSKVQLAPKQAPKKPDSLPKVVMACMSPPPQRSSRNVDSSPRLRTASTPQAALPTMRTSQASPKLRISSMPLLHKPATDPISSPIVEIPPMPLPSQVPTESTPASEARCTSVPKPHLVSQVSSPRGQPDPSISNCLPLSTSRKAPVAPIITSPKTSPIPIRGSTSRSTPPTELPGINAPTFTIRGAATAIPSNQKQPTPVTTKQPSIQGAPTGPRFPSITPKGRPSKSKSGPNAPPEFISAAKMSSEYTQLTNLPENSTEAARRISELPTLRPLRLRSKKRLVGLDRGKAALEAALGQLRGETPSNPCGRCTRGKGKGPFQNCIVVPGEFAGACCNCVYYDDGRECPLRDVYIAPDTPTTDANWDSSVRAQTPSTVTPATLESRIKSTHQHLEERNDMERNHRNNIKLFPNQENGKGSNNETPRTHAKRKARRGGHGTVGGSSSRFDPVTGFFRSF